MGYDTGFMGSYGYPTQAARFGNWGNYGAYNAYPGMPMGNPYERYNANNPQGFWGGVIQPNTWAPSGFNSVANRFQNNASGFFGGVGRNFSYDAPPQLDFPMPDDLGTLFGGRDQYSDINYPSADFGFTNRDDFFAPNDNTDFDFGSNRLAGYFTNLNPFDADFGSHLRDGITNFGNDLRSSILDNFGDDTTVSDSDPNGLAAFLGDLSDKFGTSFNASLNTSLNTGNSATDDLAGLNDLADLLRGFDSSSSNSSIFVDGNKVDGNDWSDGNGNFISVSSSSSGNAGNIDLSGLNDALAGLNNLFGNGNGLRV